MIVPVGTRRDKKRYIEFIRHVYRGDSEYCDMNIMFVETFLYARDGYARRCDVRPIIIEDDSHGVKAVGTFIADETAELKLAFLEFEPDAVEQVRQLRDYGAIMMELMGKDKLVIGINGQISYGLGILSCEHDTHFEFNSNYNPAYYLPILDNVFPVKKNVYSYHYDMNDLVQLAERKYVQRCFDSYSFRYIDPHRFKDEMLLFGKLVHETLKDTPYYSEKTPEEFYELMKPMRWLMRERDLVFAMDGDEAVGFIYTHPDYAELFDKPHLNYIKVFTRFLGYSPDRIICNVLGVLPRYRNSGIAIALIAKAAQDRYGMHSDAVSSFVIEDNKASTMLCSRLAHGKIHKSFALYELPSEGDRD